MERNEKLEMLTALVRELGFSCDDVVNYWKARGKLVAEQVQNKTEKTRRSPAPKKTSKAQQYQTPEKVIPGMFVYVDGLISSEIIEGRQIKAVVGSVNGSDVLAVCLHEVKLPWASKWLEVPETEEMLSGKKATHKILEIAQKEHTKAEAAQWCYDYAEDGVKRGEAFLPSITELEQLCANGVAINASLNALGVALLDGWYWSSTEYNGNYAWTLGMRNGSKDGNHKGNYGNYVHPVLALKL